ncbi:hypothetical protein LguiB_013644 [Lonicera macranthoides]
MKGVSLENHIIHIQELVTKEGHVSASAFAFAFAFASEIPSSPIICRVPNNMREVDPQAYEPNAVSIGPFYYGDDKLLPIQLQHKRRFYSHLINHSRTAIDHNSLKESVDKLVPRARRCYSHNFDEIQDSDFSLMMVLDGCFILELFRCDHKLIEGNVIDDPIFDTRWIMPALRRDLTKMGNQLPFFILEELYNLTNLSTDHQEPSLLEYTISFFAPLLSASAYDVNCAPQIHQLGSSHAHLLTLFHSTFNPVLGNSSISIKETELTDITYVGSVTELGRYGIKIMKGNGHLLNIKYARTLKVPPLLLDYGTVHVFQNLVAYEQCGGRSMPSYFTTYVMILSELAKSSKDVISSMNKGLSNICLSAIKKQSRCLGVYASRLHLTGSTAIFKCQYGTLLSIKIECCSDFGPLYLIYGVTKTGTLQS